MSTFVMPHEIINSTPTALKPVDATQFSGTGSNFQKIVDEWTGGTNTDLFVAKLKGTAINTDMGSPNTIGEDGQTTFHGDGSNLTGIITGSGDTLAVLEQRVNNEQHGAGSDGSNDGVLASHVAQPWLLLISGTITAGASTCTLVNAGNLINIEAKNSYVIQDADATASGKQEIIKINSVTYGSGTIATTLDGTFSNSYASGAYVSGCGGSISGNSLSPKASAISTHAAYTKNIDIRKEIVEPVSDGTIDISWRVAEKWFYVSGFIDNITIQVTSVSGDAALMPQYYEGTTPFKVALIKVSKNGNRLKSIKSAALSGKNFIVFDLAAASTGTTTTTINLASANPVYGTAEASESFNNNGTTTLKWIVLPLTILKEVSAVDQAAFESWLSVTIDKILIPSTILPRWVSAYFPMNEASGNLIDYLSGNPIAQVGTVGQADGLSGKSRGVYSTGNYHRDSGGNFPKLGSSCLKTMISIFWFKHSNTNDASFFGNQDSGATATTWRIGKRGDTDQVVSNIGNSTATTPGTYFDNNWHCCMGGMRSISGTAENRIYIDGVQVASANGADWTPSTGTSRQLIVGASYGAGATPGASPMDGYMQHLILIDADMISNHALTWTDLERLYADVYNAGKGRDLAKDSISFMLRGDAAVTGTANKLSVKTTIWSKARANSMPSERGSQAVLV